MAKINTTNYQPVTAWNGTQDLFVVEQPDGTKVATPEQIRQYMNAFMDDEPTEGSEEAVKSGGVFNAIENSVSLKSATGNPIILTDAANANAEKLSMTIEPIQSGSGDPSPTNVRPISGISEAVATRTGKNLVVDFIANSNISAASQIENYNAAFNVYVAPIKKGKTYIATTGNQGFEGFVYAFYTEKPTRLSVAYDNTRYVGYATAFVAPIDGYIAFRSDVSFIEGQLELGSTATAYEAPTPATATITFGQTVYGGEVDFKTGIVTLTRGAVDMGLLTWTYHSATSSYSDFFDTVLPNDSILGDSEIAANIISPIYKTIPSKWIAYQGYDNGVQALAKDSRRFITCDNRFNNAADYTNAMTGNILVYELATPTTLTLTPAELELLKGNNTITANGVEISIEYYPNNAVGVLAKRVDNKADITYVDNAVDGVVKHVAGKLSITIPLSDSWTASIFGTISATPISAILTVVSGGNVSVTDLTSNSLASRADISVSVSDKTITLTSKNTDKFYVNIVY